MHRLLTPCLFVLIGLLAFPAPRASAQREAKPFGEDARPMDTFAVGEWWTVEHTGDRKQWLRDLQQTPRDEAMAFALYTHDHGVLKLSAQCFPLMPDEPQEVTLEFQHDGEWVEADVQPVQYPGWSAHFRVEGWDNTADVPYRVRLGDLSTFEGLIRRDPIDKPEIVVGNLSCNSNQDRGDRAQIVANLLHQNPDLLFFAGDQSYDHLEHTAAWLVWGRQFADVIRDRPTVTIPDDHDIGQGNLWGEGGIPVQESFHAGDGGGYVWPADYVRMVERCQTWHLPDPYDATPIAQDIGVYYTRLRVGTVDFAILEDRKFKSGPFGKIPPDLGPRPDHITDPTIDVTQLDQPGLVLLGERQLDFLDAWAQDWEGVTMKVVLSQTNFCGAVTHHGNANNRLICDLDSGGWPQTGRDRAVAAIRRAMASHLAGDQHLSVVVKHGIDDFDDGPYSFVSPAIVNNYYGRWWMPDTATRVGEALPNNPLADSGRFLDGFLNPITMHAYVNPARPIDNGNGWADGYGLARYHKTTRTTTFECWPRHTSVADGGTQYAGFPVTFRMTDNDGRTPTGYLPAITFDVDHPVVSVTHDDTGEVLYTYRITGRTFAAPVYADGSYTVTAGRDTPDTVVLEAEAVPASAVSID